MILHIQKLHFINIPAIRSLYIIWNDHITRCF
jgi:hypothetical protein